MDVRLLTAPGEPIRPEEVAVPKARDLVDLLRSGRLDHVRLVETRRDGDGDVVVFDVEPEVPQRPAYPIAHSERVAVIFYDDDDTLPETVALRDAFPRDVLHLNLRPVDYLWASLCLYEEAYLDLKLRWTAAAYLRRVQEWLTLTARGELHQADQPPEPFLLPNARTLVLPPDLYDGAREGRELVIVSAEPDSGQVLLARWRGKDETGSPSHPTLLLVAEPHVHGPIQRQPRTLEELHTLLEPVGLDVLGSLRERMREWFDADPGPDTHLAVVVVVPRARAPGVEPERYDKWVFHVGRPVRDLGAAFDLWDFAPGGTRGVLIGQNHAYRGQDVPVETLRAVLGLSRAFAAQLSGASPSTVRVVSIGAGALGSQVVDSVVRTGWGDWTIVDNDRVLPHNLVRHRLAGWDVGASKAVGVARAVESIYHQEVLARPIVADVLASAEHRELAGALAEADLILDMSASPTVARHLALNIESRARRISMFMNPAGTDLVLLAEDAERRVRLDDLEMQYYRLVIRRAELEDHLRPAGERLRYGQSCRDITLAIPQDRFAVAAGIGARAMRDAHEGPEARLAIWRLQPDLGVDVFPATIQAVRSTRAAEWEVRYDEEVVAHMIALREQRLPSETGGILIGHRDMQRRIVYVVDVLPAPPDSVERPVYFERGSAGLRAQVEEVGANTAGALTYVGEWHSHPRGHGVVPSADDRRLFAWLERHLGPEGVPPLMMIAGDEDVAVYVATLP